MGFRGEALAAIAAVSRVDILTRRREDDVGAALRLEGGVSGEVESAGAPEGTAITVRDLFYNTPARLKFMKKDSAETAAVNGLMQHLALSHPNISFKFVKDGIEALHTPGDGRLDSAIYAALGRDFARSLLPVEGRGGDIVVSGFVTKPLQGRGSRSMQVFFVNGRFIKSQLLTAALEEGYRNQIMKGKFPGCVLAVTLPVTAVDVNVHPAKTQVKFAREKDVFDAVFHTVLDSLAARGGPVRTEAPPPETVVNPRQDFFRSMEAKTYRENGETASRPASEREQPRPAPQPARSAAQPLPAWDTERPRMAARLSDSAPEPFIYREERKPAPPIPARPAPDPAAREREPRPFVPAIPAAKEELPGQRRMEPEQAEAPWRIAGEVLRTYIICESEDGCIWLIDKHAAHERINFDRLKAAQTPPMRQTLLQPLAAELGQKDKDALMANLPLLERFGFACEDFGGGTILVREVPADMDAEDTAATLEELATGLFMGRTLEERRDAMLHTMACKAAIKGGWKSDPAELRALVDRVQSGEVRYCPHGRPVAVKVSKYELEKMFKRA